jgi:hypothetical protein
LAHLLVPMSEPELAHDWARSWVLVLVLVWALLLVIALVLELVSALEIVLVCALALLLAHL